MVPISIEHVVIAHEGAFRHPPFRRGPPRALRQFFHALVPDVAFDILKASDQLEILAKKLHKALNQSRATIKVSDRCFPQAIRNMRTHVCIEAFKNYANRHVVFARR